MAVSVSGELSDQRAAVKRKIDVLLGSLGSEILEEKSYAEPSGRLVES